jgi:hypothetical protein
MPPRSAAVRPPVDSDLEAPRLYANNAEAAAYIEELLDELADLAEAAGHHGLSTAIMAAALKAARIAARAAEKSA